MAVAAAATVVLVLAWFGASPGQPEGCSLFVMSPVQELAGQAQGFAQSASDLATSQAAALKNDSHSKLGGGKPIRAHFEHLEVQESHGWVANSELHFSFLVLRTGPSELPKETRRGF